MEVIKLEEIKKLNIFQKIQKVRVELQKKDVKKTGLNKFSNYKYFELSDFLPHIMELCDKYGIYTEFQYTNEEAKLIVFDTESKEFREWTTPIEVAALKGCSSIQNIGGTQSYARRYLYTMAFEIAESDMVDAGQVDQAIEEGKQKIKRPAVLTLKKLIVETETDESKFLNWAGAKRVEDITNDMLKTCLDMLEKKKKVEAKDKKVDDPKQEKIVSTQEDFEF